MNRAAVTTSFLLASMAVISGCGSSVKKAEHQAAQEQSSQKAAVEQRANFKKRCGDPLQFPVSDECARLAGSDGPALRRQSDLTMAVWRACALTPSSAETIRQDLVAKGAAKSTVGQKMIGEMERTEQHSDSPCVVADLRDLDCVGGNSEACESARNADPACVAWMNDNDTQARLRCINRAVHDQVCMAKAPDSDNGENAAGASYFSDSQVQAEDCVRMEKSCLHSFDECSNAKDALALFLKPQTTAPSRPAQ
jgi:hypothetical protein